MNKKQRRDHTEEAFFHAANLMYGMPEIGKSWETMHENFQKYPNFEMKMMNVKQWLRRSQRGTEFIALAIRHGFVHEKMAMDGLYRRYCNWYFGQRATNDQETHGTTGEGAGTKPTA